MINLTKDIELLNFELSRVISEFKNRTGHVPTNIYIGVVDSGAVEAEVASTVDAEQLDEVRH